MAEGPGFIQVPTDGAGKKTRTNVRDVSGNEVHEQFIIGVRPNGLDPYVGLAMRVDEASSDVTYIGEAPTGTAGSASSWRLRKMIVSGAVTTVLWADGNENFDNVWDDRATTVVYS